MGLDDDIQHKQPMGDSVPREISLDTSAYADALTKYNEIISAINGIARYDDRECKKLSLDKTNKCISIELDKVPKIEGFRYVHDHNKGKVEVVFERKVGDTLYSLSYVPQSVIVPREIKRKFEEILEVRYEDKGRANREKKSGEISRRRAELIAKGLLGD